jgi:hypothetical protein
LISRLVLTASFVLKENLVSISNLTFILLSFSLSLSLSLSLCILYHLLHRYARIYLSSRDSAYSILGNRKTVSRLTRCEQRGGGNCFCMHYMLKDLLQKLLFFSSHHSILKTNSLEQLKLDSRTRKCTSIYLLKIECHELFNHPPLSLSPKLSVTVNELKERKEFCR